MIGDWAIFEVITQNLVVYFTGSYAILALVFTFFFLLMFLATGIEFKFALPLVIPILSGFVFAGWLGNISYVYNIGLIILALIYAFAMIKIVGGK